MPGSKSETNRALVLAALADGPSTLTGVLNSRDSDLMCAALRQFGVEITQTAPGQLRISPPGQLRGGGHIDCGLAGTVMRFVPGLAVLADEATRFHGDAQAEHRPMAGLLDGLRQLGSRIEGDGLPFTVFPAPARSNHVSIDASASSQFISGLLLIGARLPQGLVLRHLGGDLPSRPHIEMTVAMLRDRGVVIEEPEPTCWVVHPGPVAASDCRIEPDLTNAAAFLAAGAATGGSVTVPGWPAASLQPGIQFLEVAEAMGCRVVRSADSVTVIGPDRLHGVTVDLHAASELTPVVAALGALAEGTTRITGVAHIRGHETDRLAALATELSRLGVAVAEAPDGLEITGGLPQGPRLTLHAYADHRMVHFAALVALRRSGLSIDDLDCVGKTMPQFPHLWARLVGS